MKLVSPTKTINQSAKFVFEKLRNPQQFKNLMPDNLEFFELTDNGFSFSLKGIPKISLAEKQSTEYQIVSYHSNGGNIPFELHFNLKEITSEQTEISVVFEGNFNPMLQMMVKSPISKFIETILNKL